MRNMHKSNPIFVVGLAVISLMQGCASVSVEDSSSEPSVVYAGSISLPKGYDSIAELEKDSDCSVRGEAKGSRVEVIHMVPFTVTDFVVAESSDKAIAGRVIEIYQTGSVDHRVENATEILQKSQEYLLLLTQVIAENGKPVDGQYLITGEQGGWKITKSGVVPIFEGSPTLARVLSQEEVDGTLRVR